jgi:dipeptidyl aminopeptidase/acylaminoacyl peptidase
MVVYEPSTNTQVSAKLHVYDGDTGKDRVVGTLQKSVSDPTWSRDGQWLIVKMSNTGSTEQPDPKIGWHTFQHEGIWAVSVANGQVVTLKEPNEETKGLDWFETAK